MNGNYPAVAVRGIAALMQALNTLSHPGEKNSTLAKIIVENEVSLRQLIDFGIYALEKWGEEPFRG